MGLKSIADLFLVPSGVLIAALGVAGSEPLKTGVSAIGLLLAALWVWSTIGSNKNSTTNFESSLLILPWIFGILWLVSLVVHSRLWLAAV